MGEPNQPNTLEPATEEMPVAKARPPKKWHRVRWAALLLLAPVLVGLGYFLNDPLGYLTYMWNLGHNYTARARLFVSFQVPSNFPSEQPTYADRMEEFKVCCATQAALMKNRSVLNVALRNPRIAQLSMVASQGDPVAWLQMNLKVDFTDSPEVMRVSLSGHKSQELVVLLNALVDAYLDEVVSVEQRTRLDRLQKLKDISANYEETVVRAKRLVYRELVGTPGCGYPNPVAGLKTELLKERAAALFREYTRIELELATKSTRLKHLHAKKKNDAQTVATTESLQDELALLTEQKKTLESMSLKVRDDLIDSSPKSSIDLEAAKDEIDRVESIAKKLRDLIERQSMDLNVAHRVLLLERADISQN